jgi:hypothetical protein
VNGNAGRLSDAIERLLPFLIVVGIVTSAYFWLIQTPLNAYLRTRTDLVSLRGRVKNAQDGVARAGSTAPVDMQAALTQFEAQVAPDDRVADVTAILAKAVLDSAPADQLRGFAIETSDRIKANDQGAPRVTAATLGTAPDPRFALFPYSVTYTPVKLTFSSTFEAIASVLWKVRDLPTTIEVKSATLTRGLPLMKMELLIWVYQRGRSANPDQGVAPAGPAGPTIAPVGPRVARLAGAEG